MNIASTLWPTIWRYLEAIGHARGQRELQQLAARWELTDPVLAHRIRHASLRRPESETSVTAECGAKDNTAGKLPSAKPRPAPNALALLQRR